MLSFPILSACLLMLATAQASYLADRTTGRLAPRALTSGGTTCYFSCPEGILDGESSQGLMNSEPSGTGRQCNYTGGEPSSTCTYTSEGNLDGSATNASGCPQTADIAVCQPSSDPVPDGLFRRSTTRVARPLKRGDKLVKARQYKPKKGRRAEA